MSTTPYKASPRREPPKSPTVQPLGTGIKISNAGVAAYNGWYNTMNSEWAWLIYTVIALALFILGVFVYHTFMYPSLDKASATPSKIVIDKIPPI